MTDIFPRSAFIEAERFTNDRPQKVGSGFAGPAYNFKIADFIPFVNDFCLLSEDFHFSYTFLTPKSRFLTNFSRLFAFFYSV